VEIEMGFPGQQVMICQLPFTNMPSMRELAMMYAAALVQIAFLSLFSLPSLVVNSSKCPQKHYFSNLHFAARGPVFAICTRAIEPSLVKRTELNFPVEALESPDRESCL
jgi:hypothetical protein